MRGRTLQKCQMLKEPGGSGEKRSSLGRGLFIISIITQPYVTLQNGLASGEAEQNMRQLFRLSMSQTNQLWFWLPLIKPTTVEPKKRVNNSSLPSGGKTQFL